MSPNDYAAEESNCNLGNEFATSEKTAVRYFSAERLPTKELSERDQLDDARPAHRCLAELSEEEDLRADEGSSQRRHEEQKTNKSPSGEAPDRTRGQHLNGNILLLQNGKVHSKYITRLVGSDS